MSYVSRAAVVRRRAYIGFPVILKNDQIETKIVPWGQYDLKLVTDEYSNPHCHEEVMGELICPRKKFSIPLTHNDYKALQHCPDVEIH